MSQTATPVDPTQKARGAAKMARIRVEFEQPSTKIAKPDWIRVRIPQTDAISKLKAVLRENKLHSVCEEASCPNLPECFGKGTATFMIMGDKCTRRCTFCDVGHGRPDPLDQQEPHNLAKTIAAMGLNYVVITSVDRDDLRDGGAAHFAACIEATRATSPHIKVEVLVPDFRGRMEPALQALAQALPDVFNHNIETVPRLYRAARPGSDYQWSLTLLKTFKERYPEIPTKSGIMLGLGETFEEVVNVLHDLKAHRVDRVTLGQYLQPSIHHIPVARYVTPAEFETLAQIGAELGFNHVASGPLVRSSYHADKQDAGDKVS